MASLLVYVDPDRLAAMCGGGGRAPGRVVSLRRADLPNQLERLDERSTLFLVTVEGGRAVLAATLEDPQPGDVLGEATLHDHDITALLVRLGCDKVWLVPEWASVPRIVPPNDVDLLRYALGLALLEEHNLHSSVGTPEPPPPQPPPQPADFDPESTDPEIAWARFGGGGAVASAPSRFVGTPAVATASPHFVDSDALTATAPGIPLPASAPPASPPAASPQMAPGTHDTLARALLAAIYAHPAADAPRRAYASVLRDLGDPRGRLIDLQLDRCRTGGPITREEEDLVRAHRDACAGPLRPFLTTFELSRGFVSRCVIGEDIRVDEASADDPAWGTVEDIATIELDLLTSQRLVARTARIRGRDFGQLAEHTGLLPFEILLPYPATLRHAPARESHGIVLDPANLNRWPSVLDGGALMRVRAIKLDAVTLGARMPAVLNSKLGQRLAHLDAWIDPETALRWREAFDRAQLPLLTLRAASTAGTEEASISIERTTGAPRVIVQSAPDDVAVHMVRAFAHDLGELEVATADLFGRLRPFFKTVTLRPRPALAL